jgi:hypothetical protein
MLSTERPDGPACPYVSRLAHPAPHASRAHDLVPRAPHTRFMPRAPNRASFLAPRAALALHRQRLVLCSAALCASRLNSRCAQPRSDLRAVASSSVLASSFTSTSVHLGAASRWAHVATVCFIRFRCRLYIFHLDVAKVDLMLHMLQ